MAISIDGFMEKQILPNSMVANQEKWKKNNYWSNATKIKKSRANN